MRQGRYKLAVADFTASIALNKSEAEWFSIYAANHADALEARAVAFEHLGDTNRANADRVEAIRQSPQKPREYRARSIIHLARGEYRLAAADAEQAAKLDSFKWFWVENIATSILRFSTASATEGSPNQKRK